MANQPETPTYDVGVYQIQTTDAVLGGLGGIANQPLLNLADRTAYLKVHMDNLENGTTVIPGYALLNSPVFTGTPTCPTAPVGDVSLKIANTTFVNNALDGIATVSVAGGSNVVLTQAQWGFGIILLTGALTADITVTFPNQDDRWVIINASTGAFVITCQPVTGTGIVVAQGFSTEIYCDATNIHLVDSDNSNVPITGQCRLTFVSSTQLQLIQKNGGWLWINGAAHFVPSAGVNLANTGLVAATKYYIYAAMSHGTMILEASTTGHTVNASDGTRVKSGDATRALVGMAFTGAGSPGVFQAQGLGTISWFERLTIYVPSSGAQNSGPNGNTGAAELNSAARANFVTWAEESVVVGIVGSANGNTVTANVVTGIGVDSATPIGALIELTVTLANAFQNTSQTLGEASLSEGAHFATPVGAVSSGQASWAGLGTFAVVRG